MYSLPLRLLQVLVSPIHSCPSHLVVFQTFYQVSETHNAAAAVQVCSLSAPTTFPNLACHVTLLLQEIATLLADDMLVIVMLVDETLMTCVCWHYRVHTLVCREDPEAAG